MENQTNVNEFILVGLSNDPQLQIFLFLVFLVIYLITLVGNTKIMLVIREEPHLHTPMYFFLSHLSFVDIIYSSAIVPKMLVNFLAKHKTISVNGCIAQMFFIFLSSGTEVFFLVGMAVDQYVAIHKPLRYLIIMNQGVCVGIVALSWLGGLAHSAVQIGLILQLPYCGPNILDNFYCDVPQIIKLACTDTHVVKLQMVFNGGVLLVVVFIILMISYTIILVKIRTHVTDGKHKALSTCGTQITVVCLIFIPTIFIYAQSFKKFALDKVVSVIYRVITPMLNSMIYMLRNAEMKKAIKRLVSRILFSGRKLKA
ncbi:olfactory receptor 4D1-like [Emydura macquarii macquarii]|uniref:olfactory receptor 4D1-like n=1 Tax=Emydura macquarii macquarii TaxID=1129001 RepID=UPI00352BBF25